MNQGRIWCVVNPTVGLPLFLGSVTLIAIGVHYSVLSHTTWFGSYWQGGAKAKTALNQQAPQGTDTAAKGDQAYTFTVAPSTDGSGAQTLVLSVSPNGVVTARSSPAADGKAPPGADKLVLAPPVGQK